MWFCLLPTFVLFCGLCALFLPWQLIISLHYAWLQLLACCLRSGCASLTWILDLLRVVFARPRHSSAGLFCDPRLDLGPFALSFVLQSSCRAALPIRFTGPREDMFFALKKVICASRGGMCVYFFFLVLSFDCTLGFPGEGPCRPPKMWSLVSANVGSLNSNVQWKTFDDHLLCLQDEGRKE